MGEEKPLLESEKTGNPLTFAFWGVRTDIVLDNVRKFESRHGERVEPRPTPEPYEPALRQQLERDGLPDVFYAQRGEASRWYAQGLVQPIDDMPGLDELCAAMQPAVRDDSVAWDGRFLGLTYYNGGPFCLFRNERLLAGVGLVPTSRVADYPRHWYEVEEQARVVRQEGHSRYPLLMRWFAGHTGLAWNFIADCHAEGDWLVGSDGAATFGRDTGAAEVLERWCRWYRDGLVPPDVFAWDDERLGAAWMSGQHAFHATLDYHAATYADPARSRIHAHNHINPVYPGRSGQPVLVGHPLLCVSRRQRTRHELERVWNLLRYLGGKDADGEFTVHRRWASECNFEVPYPGIYAEPEVQARMETWMYPALARESLQWMLANRERAIATPLMRMPWYHDWDALLHRTVVALLRDQAGTPAQALVTLRERWDALRDEFIRTGRWMRARARAT